MKKLKLKALELGAGEVLTREQLKSVFGGVEMPSGSGDGPGGCGTCAWGDCFMCCTPDFHLCGQCNACGIGCQGHGVALRCYA